MKKRPFKSSFEAEKAKCHLRFLYKNFRLHIRKKVRNIGLFWHVIFFVTYRCQYVTKLITIKISIPSILSLQQKNTIFCVLLCYINNIKVILRIIAILRKIQVNLTVIVIYQLMIYIIMLTKNLISFNDFFICQRIDCYLIFV